MALFTGTFPKQIDRKGRVSVPAQLRSMLLADGAKSFFLKPVIGQPAYEALPTHVMEQIADRIDAMDFGDPARDEAEQEYFSASTEVSPDGEGRIMVPPSLLEETGATDQLLFVGRGRRLQIWAPGAYEAHAKNGPVAPARIPSKGGAA